MARTIQRTPELSDDERSDEGADEGVDGITNDRSSGRFPPAVGDGSVESSADGGRGVSIGLAEVVYTPNDLKFTIWPTEIQTTNRNLI